MTDHATRELDDILRNQPQQFKIGVTANPKLRFFVKPTGQTDAKGYYYQGYRHLVILAYGNCYAMGFLEKSLINKFRNYSGCMNIAGGGDGLNEFSHAMYFLYVALHTVR